MIMRQDTPDFSRSVDTSVTLASEELLAYTTQVALNPSGTVVYQGSVSTYESLVLAATAVGNQWRVEIEWYDAPGAHALPYTMHWDVSAGTPYAWQIPLPAPYAVVRVYGSTGTTLDVLAIYGVRSPAVAPVLQASGPLCQGWGVSVAGGATAVVMLAPYVGPAELTLSNPDGTPIVVELRAQDWQLNYQALYYHYSGSAAVLHDQVGLANYINSLRITNSDTAAHSYTYSVIAI
jgi:hypothetical protein